MRISRAEIKKRFGFHASPLEGPDATLPLHSSVRASFESFAQYVNEQIPEGRYASLALTSLEEASMWAHKAISERSLLLESFKLADKFPKEEPTILSADEAAHRDFHSTNYDPYCVFCKAIEAATPKEEPNGQG